MLPQVVDMLSSGTGQEFREVLKLYPEALDVVIDKAKNKKGVKELKQLDKWYQEELGASILSREPPHMTSDDLTRLMSWKLGRGKFRPMLMGLIKQNAEETVIDATTKGVKLAQKDSLTEAIGTLTVLRGVGPATASAILAAAAPEHFSFYADEVAASIPSLAAHKYSLRDYKDLNAEMVQLAKRLNSSDKQYEIKDEPKWTPHQAELAVWTYYLLSHHNPDALTDAGMFKSREAEETEKKEARREKLANGNNNEENKGEGKRSKGSDYSGKGRKSKKQKS